MTTHKPSGWNTWDFRGFNRLVHLDRGRVRLTVAYAVWDEEVPPPAPDSKRIGRLYDRFRWQDARRLGPHGVLGLPAELTFTAGRVPYRAVATDEADTLVLDVRPLEATRQRIVFLLLAPQDAALRAIGPQEARFAGYRVRLEGADWPRHYFLNLPQPYAVGQPGGAATLRVTPGSRRRPTHPRRASAAPVDSTPAGLRGEGALAEAPEALVRAVAWNTLYDSRRALVVSPVSRDWCADWAGPIVFCWDTYLAAAMIAPASPELARLNFEAVSTAIDELGFVPNYYMSHGAVSLDRSMPPIGAYLVWKTLGTAPDDAWLARTYRRLHRWHRFWQRHRTGPHGLLAWGSNAEPEYNFPQLVPYNPTLRHSAPAARWESGLDNSPMYDDVPFNPRTHTLELDDVGLNSYYALDCEALAGLAERLGRTRDAAALRREYETMKQRVNALLWDERHGIYCNRHWDGRLSRRWSPTSFFPLIAGVAPRERAERLVHEHLLNEHEFWGRYVLPSIARCDPAYRDNDYWRGRIWGPFNFLVAEGLRRYRFDDIAAELARRGLEMFLHNWRADGGIYENYNAETGAGGDVWNAARLYHWGALLALVAMQELADVEPAGFLRFGSVRFPAAGLTSVQVGGAIYDVHLDDELHVRRAGQPFLECDRRAIVRLPLHAPPQTPLEITATGHGRLVWHAAPAPAPPARINGVQLVQPEGIPPVYAW